MLLTNESCSINFGEVKPSGRSNLRIYCCRKHSICRRRRWRHLHWSRAIWSRSGFRRDALSGGPIAIKSIPTDSRRPRREIFCRDPRRGRPEKRGRAKATFRDDIAASLACQAAVKINMKLTPEKMQWLIDRLLTTSSPTTCPHGRPVILRLSMKDIEKDFTEHNQPFT